MNLNKTPSWKTNINSSRSITAIIPTAPPKRHKGKQVSAGSRFPKKPRADMKRPCPDNIPQRTVNMRTIME